MYPNLNAMADSNKQHLYIIRHSNFTVDLLAFIITTII